jgi:hypothetical protein
MSLINGSGGKASGGNTPGPGVSFLSSIRDPTAKQEAVATGNCIEG